MNASGHRVAVNLLHDILQGGLLVSKSRDRVVVFPMAVLSSLGERERWGSWYQPVPQAQAHPKPYHEGAMVVAYTPCQARFLVPSLAVLSDWQQRKSWG